jgi:predicted secreted protein
MSVLDFRPANVSLRIHKGDDTAFSVTVLDANSLAVNMSAATITIKDLSGTTALTLTSGSGATIAGNVITATLTDAQADALTAGTYKYDMRVTFSDTGDTRTIIRGIATVTAETMEDNYDDEISENMGDIIVTISGGSAVGSTSVSAPNATYTYSLPAGKWLVSTAIISASSGNVDIGITASGDEIVQDATLTASQVASFHVGLYGGTDGISIYFSGMPVASKTIVFLTI